MSERYRAYRVVQEGERYLGGVAELPVDALPEGEVTVRVHYSSLNYKDALSASGNPGVTKRYPHTPGIDAAGVVEASRDPRFVAGDEVIVTSYDLGMNTPGGFAELVRVPGDWVVPLPAGLSLREAMALGTAGFTAALALDALERQGIEAGPLLVTGASGGVGSVATALLAKLGHEVWAATGSPEAHAWLRGLGAGRIVARDELAEPNPRPMLKARYGGAIDTVGGETLANVVKQLELHASVAACGVVGGAELALTVYPFILRGVNLLGVDSQSCPMPRRAEVWRKLAGPWKLDLEPLTTEIGLEQLDEYLARILRGETRGRVLVRVAA